jgi:hypothetical protein
LEGNGIGGWDRGFKEVTTLNYPGSNGAFPASASTHLETRSWTAIPDQLSEEHKGAAFILVCHGLIKRIELGPELAGAQAGADDLDVAAGIDGIAQSEAAEAHLLFAEPLDIALDLQLQEAFSTQMTFQISSRSSSACREKTTSINAQSPKRIDCCISVQVFETQFQRSGQYHFPVQGSRPLEAPTTDLIPDVMLEMGTNQVAGGHHNLGATTSMLSIFDSHASCPTKSGLSSDQVERPEARTALHGCIHAQLAISTGQHRAPIWRLLFCGKRRCLQLPDQRPAGRRLASRTQPSQRRLSIYDHKHIIKPRQKNYLHAHSSPQASLTAWLS